jgi:hypothetical protein
MNHKLFIYTIQHMKHDKAQQIVPAYKTETPAIIQ